MKRLSAALAIVAACGAPHAPAPPPPHAVGSASAPVAPPPPPPPPPPTLVRAGKLRAMIEAPPAGAIAALALTPDGTAALTGDELGGVRLWPALDGSVEPRVVDLPEPRTLALARRDAGFTAVVLDEVGGLYVANVDAEGRTRAHATIAAEPAFAGILATAAGILAWRTDQTIALLDGDGATTSRLATEAGERLVELAPAGARALALIESAGKRRGRWLELAPQLAWGPWIDAWQDLGTDVAVSPGGTRVAMIHREENKPSRVIAVELATGKPLGEAQLTGDIALGFSDDDHLGWGGVAGVGWIALDAGKVKVTQPAPGTAVNQTRPHAVFAVSGGHAVAAGPGGLLVATPAKNEYLGYGLESPTAATTAADGHLLVGVDGTFTLLDRDLRVVAAPALALPTGSAVAEVRWLGGDDWAVEATFAATGKTSLLVVDTAHGTSVTARTDLPMIYVLGYEPSTHLVALSLGNRPELDLHDPVRHRLEKVATVPTTGTYVQTELVPVAPALAGGAQVVRITMGDRPTIQWLRDPRALDKPLARLEVEGAFAGADAAGHVYMWHSLPGGALELAVYGGGKQLGTLATPGPVTLWADPKGERIVEVGLHDVALVRVDGTRLWQRELAGTQEAMWLTDGSIAITSAAGIARLDPATGEILAARCGWHFGLSATPHPQTPRIEPLCAQLGR